MTEPQAFDAGIARQIGHYADAVRVPAGCDQIVVSGTPGLAPDGTLAGDMTGQATRAWPGFLVEIEVVAALPANTLPTASQGA
jgi:enamine deaminase RidA (YjgF/YER057c/UK114 family)